MATASRIRNWAEHLAGRRVEVVWFVDQVLNLTQEVKEIHCFPLTRDCLRFEIPDHSPCDVPLARGKCLLRMMCARLSVLCTESGFLEGSLYGGAGVIETEFISISQEGHTPGRQRMAWKVRFENTMHRQEFTIQAL